MGFGWSDLAAIPWKQGDERPADQVMRLVNHLKTVLQQEKGRTPPTEPPLPDFKAKTLKQLGAPTADSIELASRALRCSPEQLRASIEREQQRRVEAGLADAVQASQPKEAPAMESLVGKRLEICWNYTSTEDHRTKVWQCSVGCSLTSDLRSGIIAAIPPAAGTYLVPLHSHQSGQRLDR